VGCRQRPDPATSLRAAATFPPQSLTAIAPPGPGKDARLPHVALDTKVRFAPRPLSGFAVHLAATIIGEQASGGTCSWGPTEHKGGLLAQRGETDATLSRTPAALAPPSIAITRNIEIEMAANP